MRPILSLILNVKIKYKEKNINVAFINCFLYLDDIIFKHIFLPRYMR